MPLHQIIFLILTIAACGYAAVRGGAPERMISAAIFAALVATWALSAPTAQAARAYHSVEIGIALTDFALFIIILGVALISTRFWPMLMASMQGCGLFGHFAKPLGPDILAKAYYVTVAFWGYPIILLLAAATWRHRSRLSRYGVDYAWTRKLPHRYRQGWSVNELPQR